MSGLSETSRVRIVARGRVQGVWFRDGCRDQARLAGVSGWVRNRNDGTVEAVFEGPAAAVDALVAWCGIGPAGSRVTDVAVHREAPIGEAGFRIR